jgi:hypothetical protein
MVAKCPTRELVASGVRGLPAQAASVFRVDIPNRIIRPGNFLYAVSPNKAFNQLPAGFACGYPAQPRCARPRRRDLAC